MKRRRRLKWLMSAVLCGGVMLQLGGCLASGVGGMLAAIDFCALLGPDCVLGPIAPCGDPTTAADDLLADCPPPV